MEWGCMQALIDFDGWRKWKDFVPPAPEKKSETDAKKEAAKAKKAKRSSLTSVSTTA